MRLLTEGDAGRMPNERVAIHNVMNNIPHEYSVQ